MAIDNRTTGRNYPLPHPSNLLAEDVQRLRDALTAIDGDVVALDQLIDDVVNGAPEALNTLNELAAALSDDANFATTVTVALGNRYTKAESDARYVQGVTQTENVFTGNGIQTTFTLTQEPPTRESLLVTVDGVVQPTSEYNLSGATLTLSEAPASGANIRVLMLGMAGPVQSASTLSFSQSGVSAVQRTVQSKLRDVVSVKDFGAVGDGATDDTAAIQAAIDSGALVIDFPPGIYLITAPLVTAMKGQHLRGSGQQLCELLVQHIAGAAIRSKHQYAKITGLLIQGSAARAAAAHTTNGFGIHVEADDVADSPSLEMRHHYIADCSILGHTGSGIYLVGPRLDGTCIERCRIWNNNGHGIAADRGHLGGRVNLGLSQGVANINNCLFIGNTGHPIALGHPSDTQSSQTVRYVMNNNDCDARTLSAAVAYSTSPMSGVWIRGSNNVFADAVVTSNTNNADVAVHVEGGSNFIRNLRVINSLASVEVGSEFTDGCTIEGIWPVGFTQPAAVLLNKIGSGKNVNIIPRNARGFSSIVNTRAVPGLRIDLPSTELVLLSDATISNSTVPVDIDLKYYMAPQERIRFQAAFFYISASTTSDAKFTFQGPSSPSKVIFGVTSSLKLDVADAPVTSIPDTAYGTVENVAASTSRRVVTFMGYVENGPNEGWFRPQFAQNVAEANNLTVDAGSTLSIFPVVY